MLMFLCETVENLLFKDIYISIIKKFGATNMFNNVKYNVFLLSNQ